MNGRPFLLVPTVNKSGFEEKEQAMERRMDVFKNEIGLGCKTITELH